jgi:hypothetical protein
MPPLRFHVSALLCAWCAAPAAIAQEARDPIEPKVVHTVIQDDATRIEETRVRGQTQRTTVTPKGMKSYEILPANAGRDMPDGAGAQRGAAGKRVWHILNF